MKFKKWTKFLFDTNIWAYLSVIVTVIFFNPRASNSQIYNHIFFSSLFFAATLLLTKKKLPAIIGTLFFASFNVIKSPTLTAGDLFLPISFVNNSFTNPFHVLSLFIGIALIISLFLKDKINFLKKSLLGLTLLSLFIVFFNSYYTNSYIRGSFDLSLIVLGFVFYRYSNKSDPSLSKAFLLSFVILFFNWIFSLQYAAIISISLFFGSLFSLLLTEITPLKKQTSFPKRSFLYLVLIAFLILTFTSKVLIQYQ